MTEQAESGDVRAAAQVEFNRELTRDFIQSRHPCHNLFDVTFICLFAF